MVALPHPANVRDLGGLPLVGGGTTRPGVLLRGDAPYAGDDPPPAVAWPPSVVIDLRSASESDRLPYGWPSRTVVHRRPLHDPGDLDQLTETGDLLQIYREMTVSAGPALGGLVGLLATDGATLLHCTAGKDRTGVAVAALLLVAGVDPAAVVADYRRTELSMEHVLARQFVRGHLDPDRLRSEWASAPAEAVGLLVERLASWPGGPRRWILDHGAQPEALDAFVSRFAG